MSHSQSVSRRSVAKGVVWAVPAVTVAATAPTLAASTGDVGATQTLTHSVTAELRSYEWDPWPATATLTVTVPTRVHVGDVIIPQVSVSLTAADFGAHYSGQGLRGGVRFWYGLGAAGEWYQHYSPEGISPYQDADGHVGLMVSTAGESVTVTDAGDIRVAMIGSLLDTHFTDTVNDFYSTVAPPTTTVMGTITVLP